nr:VOC family protein [Azospirillum picis]
MTVASIEATCAFYRDVLGMELVSFGNGRRAPAFGMQKINLHEVGRELDPKASRPTAGSGDFCLIAETPLEEVIAPLRDHGIAIEEGPVSRTGATGQITSV